MLAYHLEIQDESIADRILAFLKTLPANAVCVSKEDFDEDTEMLIDEGLRSKVVGTHEEVFERLNRKYAL